MQAQLNPAHRPYDEREHRLRNSYWLATPAGKDCHDLIAPRAEGSHREPIVTLQKLDVQYDFERIEDRMSTLGQPGSGLKNNEIRFLRITGAPKRGPEPAG